MIDRDDQNFFWVSPEVADGDGTFEQPFCSIESAMEKVEAGQTIVLMNGLYDGDVTIQISGTIDKPIKIISDDNADVEIIKGCWFLYDTSDLIISGITFKDSPHGAISVIGACQRNRFENIRFIDCGTSQKETCTLYFGGSGAECNIVENCQFTRSESVRAQSGTSVALMVSDGDKGVSSPIKHHLLRKNSFSGYSHAIIAGSENAGSTLYGHIVEYNTVIDCSSDGILVKCSDTQVHCNLIRNCRGSGIRIASGVSSCIEENRIEKCICGISVNGTGHAVVNNCIVNPDKSGIIACSTHDTVSESESEAATNLFIENNTFVNTSPEKTGLTCIELENDTTTFISKNLLYGFDIPCHSVRQIPKSANLSHEHHAISENATSGLTSSLSGFIFKNTVFMNSDNGDFENTSGFGAQGWVLKPEGFNPEIDNFGAEDNYLDVYALDNEDTEETGSENIAQSELLNSFFGKTDGDEYSYDDPGLSFHERDDV